MGFFSDPSFAWGAESLFSGLLAFFEIACLHGGPKPLFSWPEPCKATAPAEVRAKQSAMSTDDDRKNSPGPWCTKTVFCGS